MIKVIFIIALGIVFFYIPAKVYFGYSKEVYLSQIQRVEYLNSSYYPNYEFCFLSKQNKSVMIRSDFKLYDIGDNVTAVYDAKGDLNYVRDLKFICTDNLLLIVIFVLASIGIIKF